MVSFITTTNLPKSHDLNGTTIQSLISFETTNNPVIYFGTGGGSGTRGPNVRMYFTTTPGPYILFEANAHSSNYWWASYADADLISPGVFTLSASINSLLWSDSQGHLASDPQYTSGFLYAAANVAQMGFSFGGGWYYDTGVGINNQNDPTAGATLTVMDYRVYRAPPRPWR